MASPSQAPEAPQTPNQTNNTGGSEGSSVGNQSSDNRTRFFEHNKGAREILLRGQAGTAEVQNALEIIFASAPWQEQRGELDRFQLHGLIETVNEEDGSESFTCKFSECDYSNKESTNAVEHVRGSHFGNRPFLCTAPNCEWAFTRRWDLQTHQQTHDRTTTFKCNYCDCTFTRATNRVRHERHSHPEHYEGTQTSDGNEVVV